MSNFNIYIIKLKITNMYNIYNKIGTFYNKQYLNKFIIYF